MSIDTDMLNILHEPIPKSTNTETIFPVFSSAHFKKEQLLSLSKKHFP